MKRLLLFALLICPLLVSSQTITEGQSTLIYSLPKTELIISAVLEQTTETPGDFYQYSRRYLGTSDVITERKTYYSLKSISIKTRSVPDPDRTFTIIPSKKSLASQITINNKGLLCGINVTPVQLETDNSAETILFKSSAKSSKPLPLSEEDLLASAVAKMAEGAAKQIYRIRENRIDLLAGDVEYVPTDGASMKTMIDQMNEQEAELTRLFLGTVTHSEEEQSIVYTPSDVVENKVIFRFSTYDGIVDADDLSGSPYYISVRYSQIETSIPEKKKKAKEEVFTIMPVLAEITISDGKNQLYRSEITLPQAGELVPIPFDTMDKYCKAYVSPESGRLLSIEQFKKK